MSQKSDVGSCEARRRVLVTGGSGSIGLALARYHGHEFEIHSVSRGPDAIQMLSEQYPDVRTHQVDIRDREGLKRLLLAVKPEIVIHAAALKRVNQAEVKPTLAVEINVLGTLNVVNASIAAKVPVSVAISTDKACQPDNIYERGVVGWVRYPSVDQFSSRGSDAQTDRLAHEPIDVHAQTSHRARQSLDRFCAHVR